VAGDESDVTDTTRIASNQVALPNEDIRFEFSKDEIKEELHRNNE